MSAKRDREKRAIFAFPNLSKFKKNSRLIKANEGNAMPALESELDSVPEVEVPSIQTEKDRKAFALTHLYKFKKRSRVPKMVEVSTPASAEDIDRVLEGLMDGSSSEQEKRALVFAFPNLYRFKKNSRVIASTTPAAPEKETEKDEKKEKEHQEKDEFVKKENQSSDQTQTQSETMTRKSEEVARKEKKGVFSFPRIGKFKKKNKAASTVDSSMDVLVEEKLNVNVAQAPVKASPRQVVEGFKNSLKRLNDIHGRMKFFLGELKDLVKK